MNSYTFNNNPSCFSISHPNSSLSGSNLTISRFLPINEPFCHISVGFFRFSLARQSSPSDFDWDNALHFSLDPINLAALLPVLRQSAPSLNNGNGLLVSDATFFDNHDSSNSFLLQLRLLPDNFCELSLFPSNSPNSSPVFFTLSPKESLTLALLIEHSIPLLCFGSL